MRISRLFRSSAITLLVLLSILLLPYAKILAASYSVTPLAQNQIDVSVKKVMPGVVSVVQSKNVQATELIYGDPIENDNGSNISLTIPVTKRVITVPETASIGSGFIGSSDGRIVTANHVVQDVSSDYSVIFSDGTTKPATVTYRDPTDDVAVLKVDGVYNNIANLGHSYSVQKNDPISAVGNAFGKYEETVANGKVLSFDQSIYAQDEADTVKMTDLVETSMPLVPGFSGGPVIDAKGNVIGISVAADLDSGRGFYIPIDKVRDILMSQGISTA